MRRIGIVLGVAALMAATVVLAAGTALAQTAPQGTLDANSLNGQPTGEFATCKFVSSPELAAAQQIIAKSTGTLTSAQVRLSGRNRDLGSLTGSFTMQITEVAPSGTFAGNTPTRVLASTTISASEITDQLEPGVLFPLVTGVFSSPAQVVAGQQYALVLTSDSPSCDYQFAISLDSYLGLDAWALTGWPSTGWAGYGVLDLIFATYVTPPGPQSKADCKRGGYKDFGFENQGQCVKAVNHASP